MRPTLLAAVFILAISPVWAAPVKADPKAEREKLEGLWKDLDSWDSVVRTRAVFELIEHPHSAAFLDEKVRPVKVSKEQTVQWMNDLNSPRDEIRDRAFEELKYYDPRLTLDLAEQLELATSEIAKRNLIAIWSQDDDSDGYIPIGAELKIAISEYRGAVGTVCYLWRRPVAPNRAQNPSGTGEVRLHSVVELAPNDWVVNALAAIILDRIGTKTARETLAKIANGHPEALPTRIAVRLHRVGPPAELGEKFWNTDWPGLLRGDPVQQTLRVLAVADDPAAIRTLKTLFPSIKADKKTIRKYFSDLGGDKDEARSSALEAMRYIHPSLAFSVQEQIEIAVNDRARTSICYYYYMDSDRSDRPIVTNSVLVLKDDILRFYQKEKRGPATEIFARRIDTLERLNPDSWLRARLAIIALERNASDDAVAVLKQLADGHPDILPTKEAKAALKKLGK